VKIIYPAELGKDRVQELIRLYLVHIDESGTSGAGRGDKDPDDILLALLARDGRLVRSWELEGVRLNRLREIRAVTDSFN